MTLTHAHKLACRIADELRPFCDQIEIAGSIRRQRPNPADIDLVVLPKPGQDTALRDRVLANTDLVSNGPKNLICCLRDDEQTQLDVFFAHAGTQDLLTTQPTNWGSVLLCRTGSKQHNIELAQRAKRCGYKWETMRGIVNADGKVIASATERDIFEALGMAYIEPHLRETVY